AVERELVQETDRGRVRRIGARANLGESKPLETISNDRSGQLSRDAFTPPCLAQPKNQLELRRFAEVPVPAEPLELAARLIREAPRPPQPEPGFIGEAATLSERGDGFCERKHPVVLEEPADARRSPQLVQCLGIARCEWLQRESLRVNNVRNRGMH